LYVRAGHALAAPQPLRAVGSMAGWITLAGTMVQWRLGCARALLSAANRRRARKVPLRGLVLDTRTDALCEVNPPGK